MDKLTTLLATLRAPPTPGRPCIGNETVVIFTDGHDSILTAPPAQTLARFRQSRGEIVFAMERFFSWHPLVSKRHFDAISYGAGPFRYPNSGSFMGITRTLVPFIEGAMQMPRTCDRGADQIAYGWLLRQRAADFRVVSDYAARIFFVAVGPEGNHSVARAHLHLHQPSVVHVPHANPPPLDDGSRDGVWKGGNPAQDAQVRMQWALLRALFGEFSSAPNATAVG